MSMIEDILVSAQGGKLVDNLAQSFGLTSEQIRSAITELSPALALGLRNAASNPEALNKIVDGLSHPTHAAAFMDHSVACCEETATLGQGAINQLFGSNSAAGQVAQIAARDSGLRPDILTQLLPVLASVVLGGLSKSLGDKGLGPVLGQIAGSGGLEAILGQLAGGGAPTPRPQAPQAQPGGGFGGLLGALLGALLGGGAKGPAGAPPSPGAPSGLPGGLDPAAIQSAIEMIKKTLAQGAPAPDAARGGSPAGPQHAELQDVLNRVFPRG
ncbi:DUF937 domain-containing protein [Methylocystis bryophila]|uniref:DUF937 domain-containing protein n=1 Tax=Methylocystis bryophila TaxID=655015 RepID=A0A1W6MYH8_9HYPH|nr:DUF937 domain-containing protein [Methylocystis bryophila]ARN82628.1 hypothetical protein B1812_17740 [Methylocystis bryophila]BDV38841.1 hypothetical protein DSM21852_20940 [Methylocystis bryophila]